MTQTEPVVVVVAYGSPALLETALDGLGTGHDVVVVDNGGSDDVAALCRRRGTRYVRSPGNVGFAAAVNTGVVAAGPDRDVLLLNPDARLGWPDVLVLQERLHEAPRRAAVAPSLVRPDGGTEPTSWPVPRPSLPWRGVVGAGGVRDGDRVFLSGAVLLLRAEALVDVGALDERFFLYAEECDWQVRAQDRGWTVAVVPEVVAEHLGAATSDDPALRAARFHAAAERFVRKWHGRAGWEVFRAGSALSALRRFAVPGLRDPQVRAEQRRALRLYARGPLRSLDDRATR